ncbi:MAG TPA: DNA-formamidopyrimidine glycosylase family protein [Armatimonadota bacterium]|jgi:formamidopyrimidine-DNA glycosylase
MPELPDITIYIRAIEKRTLGKRLLGLRLSGPFFLRTVTPPVSDLTGRSVVAMHRLGKRIVFELEDDRFIILHLMIAGRLHWKPASVKIGGKVALAALDFDTGCLLVTEAGTKKRASLHLARGKDALAAYRSDGLDLFACSQEQFRHRLRSENHTIKRALTDPHLFSGVGNAYSDEILHRARMSPFALTSTMTEEDIARLLASARDVLSEWIDRLAAEAGDDFPEKVTAFREEMAVHGKYGKPCPVCGSPVQRVVYAENEMNYCVTCQTGGKLLADRGLSRLLRSDWPRTLDELEGLRRTPGSGP